MVPSDLMRNLVNVLERLQIRYFVTGSMATIAYGDPRFTNDIDVVVELSLEHVDALCSAFSGPDYYLSRDAIVDAVQQRFQFNILHLRSGFKIDVIVPDEADFNCSRFDRRLRILGSDGHETWFASPEDVIIKKMAYYNEGRSEKHVRDIVGVLKVRADKVDRDYITTWAARMQLTEIWQDMLQRADNP
jgi:hypothetical protein